MSKRWTYDRLVQEAHKRPEINFSLVRPEHFTNGANSLIPLCCKRCGGKWTTTISSIFNIKSGCSICAGQVKWTYDRLVREAHKRPDINFSLVRPEHVTNGKESRIPLLCRQCSGQWPATIHNIFNSKRGCSICVGQVGWTYDRLVQESHKRPEINFSLVQPEDISNGANSRIPLLCRRCCGRWLATIHKIFNGSKSGCPSCACSKGETSINDLLTQYNIPFEREVILPSLPKKRYDFRFSYNNRSYLIEYDGGQHFQQIDFFHKSDHHFQHKQSVDKLKSFHALEAGYFLIRIDYTQIDNIQQHLYNAINTQGSYYLSTPEMYSYLFS